MRNENAKWESWAALMARVQRGDPEAYRTLLDEIGPILYAFVRKRVFNPRLVDDVYQDVLLTFHKVRHAYEPSRPFAPWLFTVARNALWDALAKNRRFADREVPTENLPEPSGDSPETGLDDTLSNALQSLPREMRQAVELLKLKGCTLEEAAGEAGVSVAALKVRAHRGYVRLRRMLTEAGGKKP
jgi:RNA polymerase sigma factor (sigma-70 family)